MQIQQLSVFIENKPGHLAAPCRALAAAGINIITLSLADTREFGILRLIVSEWERAKQVLEDDGCAVTVTPVVAIEVPHRPGGMAELLQVFEQNNINIEYMYAFAGQCANRAIVVFRFTRPEEALALLYQSQFDVVVEPTLAGDSTFS